MHQGCILSPCLFNLYAEYIMQNAGLDEAQAGIKIAGKNINNLRYVIKANDAGPSVTPRAAPRGGIPWLWRQKRWPDSSR